MSKFLFISDCVPNIICQPIVNLVLNDIFVIKDKNMVSLKIILTLKINLSLLWMALVTKLYYLNNLLISTKILTSNFDK